MASPDSPYRTVEDYTIEILDGEMYIKGGPYNYDFKISRGHWDYKYYVTIYPGTSNEKLLSDAEIAQLLPDFGTTGELIVGLTHAVLGVPNEERPGVNPASLVLRARKTTTGTNIPLSSCALK